MPYIKQENRDKFQNILGQLATMGLSAGEINYFITAFLHDQLEGYSELCYVTIEGAIGVLECAKLELYRMIAAPYEDKKRKENGCISNLDGSRE